MSIRENNKETLANNNTLNTEAVIPLKYLSNFWRTLDLPLINCKTELDLSWSKDCVTSKISRTPKLPAYPAVIGPTDHVPPTPITGVTLQITSAKLIYAPEVTLFISDNIKFLENTKQGFKRIVSWNKCKSEAYQKVLSIITTLLSMEKLLSPTHWFWYKKI